MGSLSCGCRIWICLHCVHSVGPSAIPCDNSKVYARSIATECPQAKDSIDWSSFSSLLYGARAALSQEGLAMSRGRVVHMVNIVLSRPIFALACPQAASAACHTLAELLAAEGAPNNRVAALLHLAMALFPHAAYGECSQWPVQGREISMALWRLSSMPQPMHVGSLGGRWRVAVVTACVGLHDSTTRVLTKENRQLYAKMHGYELHFFADAAAILAGWVPILGDNITADNAPAFWRAHAMRRVIETSAGQYDWLFWLDCGAF